MNIELIELATIAGAIMAIVGLGTWIKKVIDKAMKPLRDMEKKLDLDTCGLRATLKYSIVRAHREYMLAGKIDRYALQTVLEMHEQYKALGGNGFIDGVIEEMKSLSIDLI
jgi:hypothetical protein